MKRVYFAAIVISMLCAVSQAAIVVQNGSFETPDTTRYDWVDVENTWEMTNSWTVAESWTVTGSQAILVSDAFYQEYSTLPLANDGDQTLEFYYENTGIYQNLGTVATEGTDITFSFSYGMRNDSTVFGPTEEFTIGLYDAATEGNALVEKTIICDQKGVWFNDLVSAVDIPVGTEVYARINSLGIEGAQCGLHYDSLSVSVTPDNGEIVLLNGSFEAPEETRYSWIPIGSEFKWMPFGSNVIQMDDAFLVEQGHTPSPAVEGQQMLELYYDNSGVTQYLGVVEAGEEDLTLSLSYAVRNDMQADDIVFGLYDSPVGGNVLAEKAVLPAGVGEWYQDSISASDIPVGTPVYARMTLLNNYEGASGTLFDSVTVSTTAPRIPGDANLDGKVDGSDVTILAGNWQAGVGDPNPQTVTWAMGDFNGDGQVDGSDVTILAGNWQMGVTAASASVPEPSVVILLLVGFALLLMKGHRRNK